MTITGKARLAGALGWPIAHSKSPQLHNFWLAQYGLDGAYLPLAVHPDNLAEVVKALPKMGFCGANATLPHKERLLDLVDVVDPIARRIGAINTLHWRKDGTLYGTNSDGFGFLANLRDHCADFDARQGRAVILGAGGSARAIAAALLDAGAPGLVIVNRSRERAEQLQKDLGGPISIAAPSGLGDALPSARLLVNATSLGMTGQPPLDCSLDGLAEAAIVADLVYAPLETALLRAAKARGHRVVDGLGMLLHQARLGFELWFGVAPEVSPALRDHVLERG